MVLNLFKKKPVVENKQPASVPVSESPRNVFRLDSNANIAQLPDFRDKSTMDLRYPLLPPFAYAHIFWDSQNNELVYQVEEPVLTADEEKIFKMLEEGVGELVNISTINVKDPNVVIEYLEKNIKVLISEFKLKVSDDTFLKVMYYIYRNFVGMNEIEPILNDYFIEDIECNGINTPIYIIHRKYRNMRTSVMYKDVKALTNFVEKLAQKCGKYISYANPLLDGRLPSGDRVNATYTADISSKGPTFCFTGGYIQLNSGAVVKIEEFFEECKSRFGSKMEGCNEIVGLSNLSCVGVDEHTLQQKDCTLKTVIKLKPPERLVKLGLEDGSKIETTLNHLFHVAGGSLEQVEAKDLKAGMFIPVPKKVDVCGCTQRINLHSLVQEFSYSKKVCIKSSQQIKELVNRELCLAKNGTGRYREQLSQKYDVHQSYFYEIMSRGNSISFEVLDKLCDAQNYGFNDLRDVSVVVYGGGKKSREKAVRIPSEVDKELGYLAGAVISDGHLSKEYVDISCYEEGFREAVEACLVNKFGKCNSYYDDNRVYLCNSFVPYFFNKVFGIPIGKKSDTVKVPDAIFRSNNEVVSLFVRGLFDGDGTTSAGLSYKTNSKELAEGLAYLLSRLGIYSYLRSSRTRYGKVCYRVSIPSPYYQTYLETVGFGSLKKLNQLKGLVAKQEDRKTFIRHDRIPSRPVREMLKKLGLSQNKLSKICGVDYNRFYYDSYSKSFVKKLLEVVRKEKNFDDVRKEVDYIQWMLDSGQEFVKVKDVEIIENFGKKPVYDIELEPCKYFIAGNKPMNVFDTIRKFTREPWTPVKLMEFGTVSPEILAYLWLLIEYEANLMIIGGTGSGKTSFLNSLAFFIPPAARIVSIEDTKELNILHENWLPSIARSGTGTATITGERHGEVSLFDLLKESFRQRPDYVIVGEIRGQEAFVMFQGAASGHPTMSTMHAESVETMVKRLETPPINLSASLVETLDAVCVMIETKFKGRSVRRLREVVEIVDVKEDVGHAVTNTPFVRDPARDIFYFKADSRVFDKISIQHGLTKEEIYREFKYRSAFLMSLYKNRIFGFKEVQDAITEYYKNPNAMLRKLGIT